MFEFQTLFVEFIHRNLIIMLSISYSLNLFIEIFFEIQILILCILNYS